MADDPYCYPGTNVLINKEDIRAADDLEQSDPVGYLGDGIGGLFAQPLRHALHAHFALH
jgi:hypothetical protein